MPYTPIQWARQSIEGRQIEADGSRLLNFYAVRPASPEEAKVPVVIQGTPGWRTWAFVPKQPFTRGGNSIFSGYSCVHAMIVIDTPHIGKRLIGLSNGYNLFDIDFGQAPFAGYDPFGLPARTPEKAGSGRLRVFTEEDSEAIPEGRPEKLVTDGRYVMFVTRRTVKVYDPDVTVNGVRARGGFVTVEAPTPDDTSAELPDEEWVDCEWVDGFFILAARGGQIFHSNLNSLDFDQLDFATAEAKADGIVGMATLNRVLYVFGTESIEQWYNAPGTGSGFTFQRNLSYISEIGALSKDCIQANEDAVFFVGSDLIVYAMGSGGKEQRISSESVEYDLARATASDLFAFTYTEEGHRFYVLYYTDSVIDGNRRKHFWVFDQSTGHWHERVFTREAFIPDGLRPVVPRMGAVHPVCSARLDGRTLVGMANPTALDSLGAGIGVIAEQRLDWGSQENLAGTSGLFAGATTSTPIEREAVAPILHANVRRTRCHHFQVDIPIRVDGETGDEITLSWSDDGRKTFTTGGRPAKQLDTGPRLRWNALGQFREGRNFRLTTTATRRVDILGAYVNINVGKP